MYKEQQAEIFKHNNDDLTVVNTARTSFSKTHNKLTTGDRKLINTLVRDNHLAPLCHPNFLFLVKMEFQEYIDLLESGIVETYQARIVVISKDYSSCEITFFIRLSLYASMKCCFHNHVYDSVEKRCPISVGCFEVNNKLKYITGLDVISIDDYTDIISNQEPYTSVLALMPVVKDTSKCFKLVPLSLRITAPCFSARQHFKSSVGYIRSEESRRYIQTEPSYLKTELRLAPEGNIKQGSSNQVLSDVGLEKELEDHLLMSLHLYTTLLNNDVAPECARQHLPQNTLFTWIETASLLDYSRYLSLRTTPHAQKEIRNLAVYIQELIQSGLRQYMDDLIGCYLSGEKQ